MKHAETRMTERLRHVSKLFLDTAPIVYYIEENGRYLAVVYQYLRP